MATIAEQLQQLNDTKSAIKTAISNRGVTVADTDTFRSYADKIGEIGETVEKTKYGVSIDNILGDVDADGNYQRASIVSPIEINMDNVRVVTYDSFMYKFANINSVIFRANNVEEIQGYAFQYAFASTDYNDRGPCVVELDGIEEIGRDANAAFGNCFYKRIGKIDISFKKLKKIYSNDAFASMAAYGYIDTEKAFPSLEEIGNMGNKTFFNFCSYTDVAAQKLPLCFPSLRRILISSGSSYSCLFGGSSYGEAILAGTKWLFPSLEEIVTTTMWGNSGTTETEIHFAIKNQASIEASAGYSTKWGLTNATIYFDLVTTITVNGVAYARDEKQSIRVDGVKTFVAWKDASDNVVYTSYADKAEPAVGTVVYSDAGTTQIGTVSEVA